MKDIKLIDMHSHILPGADHGCSTASMSVQLIKKACDSGVEAVAATPHYYIHNKSVSDFLDKRERSYEKLMTAMEAEGLNDIKIIKGAEVTRETDLMSCTTSDLRKLCYENTDYILLEMPFIGWSDWVFKTIEAIKYRHGLNPVIAHIERYRDPSLDLLIEQDYIAQFNGDNAVGFLAKKRMIDMFESDTVHIMGSDLHDDKKRNYDGFIKASAKLPSYMLEKIYENSIAILSNKALKR